MRVVRHIDEAPKLGSHGSVATLGNFDGVHRGHQAILERLLRDSRALGVPAVAITFHPHPVEVLAPERAPAALSPLRGRLERLRETGLDAVWLCRFTRSFSRIDPDEFIERYLVRWLGIRKMVVGHNVSFGRARAGNAERLKAAGQQMGFEVDVVGPIRVDGEPVSSTLVRSAVSSGDLERASRLLGRPYSVQGRVISGDQRGRGLGFPTANLRPRLPVLAPDGVYAVRVVHPGGELPGIANVGRNPTFGSERPRGVEAHLFEFSGSLYGKRIEVGLVERIRAEQKFPSAEELVAQIRRDVSRAREILGVE